MGVGIEGHPQEGQMGKRFSRYKFALTAVNGTAPPGTPLEKYKKYKAGEVKPEYVRTATSNPGSLTQIVLAPFSMEPDTKMAAQMSKRAFDKMGDLVDGSASALFHHLTDTAGEAKVNPGFVPAKATISISGTGSTTETSKITGAKYKKETGSASYTVAFGAQLSAGTERFYVNVVQKITAAVRKKNSEYTVTFSPEQFRL